MIVDALVVLSDPEANGALLTVRVRCDVYPDANPGTLHFKTPWTVVAAAHGSLGEKPLLLKAREGSDEELNRGRELVEQESNVWRVMDALREAYERRVVKLDAESKGLGPQAWRTT